VTAPDIFPSQPAEKHRRELQWWREEIGRYVEWYEGKRNLWAVPPPRGELKSVGHGVVTDAVLSWRSAIVHHGPGRLDVPARYFAGKRILDLGSGPVPLSLGFEGCRILALDPLNVSYRGLGFPLHLYPSASRVAYLSALAEEIPLPDGSVDAVVSFNALDHFDDLPRAALEIARVLRSGGELRVEVHYHQNPTPLEPWTLDDLAMAALFGHLGARKLIEKDAEETWGWGEKVTVWGT
jgi:SAM-dependent methyltransferase